jgi:hypothetical protein
MTARGLKLRAHDAEDLATLAAVLQDALVPLANVSYLRPERRFVMVVTRFRWETARDGDNGDNGAARDGQAPGDARYEDAGPDEPRGAPPFERVNSGLCFDKVRAVRFRGLDPTAKDEMLNLLTMAVAPDAITLVFAGGGEIRLEVGAVRCHMEDLGEAWPTRWRPRHLDAPAAAQTIADEDP